MSDRTKALRPYQNRAVLGLSQKIVSERRRVVAVAPTGSGKTVIAAALIASLFDGKSVLWIAHRIELLRQAYRELLEAGILQQQIGMLTGTDEFNVDARILLASINTVRSRHVWDIDLVVIDEAHRTPAESYLRVLRQLPLAPVLGLTATPWRLDGQGLDDTYDELFVMASHTELITDGYIAHPMSYGVPIEKARKMVAGVSSDRGDYAVGELARAMMRGTLMGDAVQECARLAPGQRTIVFAVNKKHGKALTKRFKRAKRPTEYLDSETPDDLRAAIVKRLTSGETEVVVNVDVLTEGVDIPPVKCIAVVRPTRSQTRFLQYTGRAARPFQGMRPIILDHAGNCYRHGLPEMDREWSLEGRKKNGDDSPQPLVKMCLGCERMIPIGAVVCPYDDCRMEQPIAERKITETEAELERLRVSEAHRVAMIKRLRAMAADRGLGEEWIARVSERLTEAMA